MRWDPLLESINRTLIERVRWPRADQLVNALLDKLVEEQIIAAESVAEIGRQLGSTLPKRSISN